MFNSGVIELLDSEKPPFTAAAELDPHLALIGLATKAMKKAPKPGQLSAKSLRDVRIDDDRLLPLRRARLTGVTPSCGGVIVAPSPIR